MREIPITLGRNLDKEGLFQFLRSQLTTPHFCFLGVSGSGKSFLLADLCCELLNRGEGLTLIDPSGDTVDSVTAAVARKILAEGRKDCLKNFHRFEPGDYTKSFGLDPGKFDPARAIHPEHRSNAFLTWLHTTVQQFGEVIQLKQGAMDFEATPRLHRWVNRLLMAAFMDVDGHGKHLPLSVSLILIDPDHPLHDDVFQRISPFLDSATLADFRRLRGYRRIEDRLRETESLLNRMTAVLCPQARQIFGARITVPIRQIIRAHGAMLWHLRPTEYFSHDAKTTFGKIAIHSVISTMMSMPPELRCRHTLIIDESSEFANEFLLWALGALRKTGLSIWLCGQDLSSWRRKELDMVPKIISQCNLVTFQQQWFEDVEILVRVLRAGDICWKELEHEVERHDPNEPYIWHKVKESSESLGVSENWSEGEKIEHSEGTSKQTSKQSGNSRSKSKTETTAEGDADTLSAPYVGLPDRRAHTDTVNRGQSSAESESTQETLGESAGESASKSWGKNTSQGGGTNKSKTISEKLVPLAKIIREMQKTGSLETDLQVQFAKFAAEIMCLAKRQAIVKIIGEKHAARIETLEVKAPFKSMAAQMQAIEWIKRELFDLHPYNFVPNYDPSEDEKLIRDFLETTPLRRGRDDQDDDDPAPDVVIGDPDSAEGSNERNDDNAYGN